jgi:glycerol-3-phosphate dehydrogenase (NAD(P)+)
MNIAVLGAGAWGIGLATLLHQRGHNVCMWEFNTQEAESLRRLREHPLKLPGVFLSESIVITSDVAEALAYGPVMVVAVPSQFLRGALKHIVKSTAADVRRAVQAWVIVSKGIENETGALMTDVLMQEVPEIDEQREVVLSGPSLAAEVARHVPTTVVAASRSESLAQMVQREFSTETFRIYTNDDVRGVELAGSTKNVIAVAAGICDGLGLGNNTKGALITRGLVEMTRLGRKMGAREETFFGLAGMGDLITTCVSTQSRNHRFGELIGSGLTMQEALKQMVMVAEGVETARAVHTMATKLGLNMPITEQVYLTLFEGKPAREAVRDLMTREQKAERV